MKAPDYNPEFNDERNKNQHQHQIQHHSQQRKHINDHEIPIGDSYRLNARKKLGSGAFGEIFLGTNLKQNENVAIKLEPTKSKNPQLFYESKIYKYLEGGEGIPNIQWCGTQGNFNILIMDYLGPSLEDLFSFCGKKFTLKTTLMLADQIVSLFIYKLNKFSRIEYIHSKNFIHRDVKPDNFLIGVGNKKNLLYVIDFGLSKRYRSSRSGSHIEYKDGKNLTGTARYASISTHLGIEQSRRDDLESVGYIMVYFLKGHLPWQGLQAKNIKEKYEMIKNKKVNTSLDKLCCDLPQGVQKIINYARGLAFDEEPDYKKIKNYLKEMMESENITIDYMFDWIIKKNQNQKDIEDNKKDKDKENPLIDNNNNNDNNI